MNMRSYHLRRLAGVWLCVFLCLGTALTAAPASAASATAVSIHVNAGSTVTILGNGFGKRERITTWASSVHGAVYPTDSADTSSNGDVAVTITARRFWEPGWWAVTLHGSSTGREAVATFQVQATPPDGRLDVEPVTVRVGSIVRFHGAGYRSDEKVSIWTTHPDQSATALDVDIGRNDGDIYFSYTIPGNAPIGRWYMTAYGNNSERFLIAAFTVTY